MKKVSILFMSLLLLMAPLQANAATSIVTTVDRAIVQMQKAYHQYSDVTATGKFANITDVYKQYNAAKAAYSNARAEVVKSGGTQKASLLLKLDTNYKTYITERVIPYIDAYNYTVKNVQANTAALQASINAANLDGVQESYHEISYQLKARTVIIYRVYGLSTRNLFKAYKQEAQDLRDSMVYDVSVAMKLDELNKLLDEGLADSELSAAKDAARQVKEYLPKVSGTFKGELTEQAEVTLPKYEEARPAGVTGVAAENGTVTVTLDKQVTEVPEELVFVKNGQNLEIAPGMIRMDGNKLVVAVPKVERTTVKQEIVYGVKLGSGEAVNAAPIVLEALVAPETPEVTGIGGEVVKSAAPAVKAVEGVTYTAVLKKDGVEVDGYTLGTEIREEGKYELTVTAEHDGLTAVSEVSFTVDTTPPVVTFNVADETVYEGAYVVSGTVEAGATVTVNGEAAAVDAEGHFTKEIALAEGVNRVVVVAADAAGNASSELSKAVTYIVKVSSVVLPVSATVKSGGTKQLSAVVSPANATNRTVVWETSDAGVAIVDENGLVTGVAEGTATITATADGKSASTVVTVSDRPELVLYSYPSVLINNVIQSLSVNVYSRDEQAVTVEKVELYEKGRLYTTYTPSQLEDGGVATTINPYASWGFSVNFKYGMWLDNSSVKITVKTQNGKTFEFETPIKSSF
ncbi:Ig-like domain-containing protein [Bacillus sp. FJAT-27245]|uniref:Ig-like domain-containing protein n=1 Tax=Bacillus sp. FJAT-27245 TaxID=1684144 RepID=UPI0006A792D7|nr:Ig-like domain-containing protein [Bacillus sp. FJAT-27245]